VGGAQYPTQSTPQSTFPTQEDNPSGRPDLQIGDVRKIWQGSEEGEERKNGEQTVAKHQEPV